MTAKSAANMNGIPINDGLITVVNADREIREDYIRCRANFYKCRC